MPQITEKDGEFCLEGYGDADKCYPTEDDAKAAQVKLMDGQTGKEAAPPVELSKEAEERIVVRLIKALTDVNNRLRGNKDEDNFSGFKVVGNHWLAVYSNSFKDRDGQFFPEVEIDAYVKRVDMGMVPKPELQVWHAGKATSIGSADWVDRHGHFTFAAGQFYGGDAAVKARDYYSKHAKETGLSHGFTHPSKDFDGKHFKGYNTFEISLLPRGAEANWYTSLEEVKELQVDEKKIAYLKEVFGEDHANRILTDWDKRGKALEALDVEYKDFTGTPLVTETANKEAAEKANQSFTAIVPDLMEGSAEAVTAALEAVQVAKAEKAARIAQDGVIADVQRQLKELRELIGPGLKSRASEAAETTMPESALSKEVQDALKAQNTVKDPFWMLDKTTTP